jgi:excisionase family DNA binding protein
MNITFDRKADSGYIKLSGKKIANTIPVSDYCNVDIDAQGGVVGIELLFISRYMDDFKRWLDFNSAAEYLNKSAITIRRWIKEDKIPYYKPAKEYLFLEEDLDEFMRRHKKGPG